MRSPKSASKRVSVRAWLWTLWRSRSVNYVGDDLAEGVR